MRCFLRRSAETCKAKTAGCGTSVIPRNEEKVVWVQQVKLEALLRASEVSHTLLMRPMHASEADPMSLASRRPGFLLAAAVLLCCAVRS